MYKKVIIVDDEITEAKCLEEIISWNDYGLSVAECFKSAKSALDYLETEEIAVIISDIRMPYMDGIEFCRIVHDKYPEIIFIFISAYSDFEYAKKAIEYRVFDYITKPIDLLELENTCKKLSNQFKNDSSLSLNVLKYQHILVNYLTSNMTVSQLSKKLKNSDLPHHFLENNLLYISVSFNKLFSFLSSEPNFTLDKVYSLILDELIFPDTFIVPLIFTPTEFKALVFGADDSVIEENETKLLKKASEIIINDIKQDISLKIIKSYTDIQTFKKLSNISAILKVPKERKSNFALSSATQYIEENYMRDISLFDIATNFDVTPYHICRVFKKELNTTFNTYLNKVRIEHARSLLLNHNYNNDEICKLIGINSPTYFYQLFKSYTGMTPHTFRETHKEENT